MVELKGHRSAAVISPALAKAARHHQAGRLAEAEALYREILSGQSDQPEILHLLGALYGQKGRADAAVELISHALRLKPEAATFHISLARNLKSLGRLDDAIAAYRHALRLKPDSAEAQSNLGVALRAAGRLDESQAAFRAAITIDENFAEAHNNLGNLLIEAGRFEEAIAACRYATILKPGYGDAFNNLGNALMGNERIEDALTAYRQALQINPNHPEALNNLGIALRQADLLSVTLFPGSTDGRPSPPPSPGVPGEGERFHKPRIGAEPDLLEDSLAALQQAIKLRPTYAEAYNNLGNTLRSMGKLQEAVAAYELAVNLKPAYVEAHNNLAVALWESDRHEKAIASCQKAIELKPNFAEAHNSLGNVLRDRGDIDDAVIHYQRALELNPNYAEAHSNLAVALKDLGRFDEAIDHARRAIAIRPDHPAHSNLIYLLHFHPDYDLHAISQEQTDWHRQHAKPLGDKTFQHKNRHKSDRRLRIGYIAPYFRRHVVGLNILPLVREHDRKQFEIFCYSDVMQEDSITKQFAALADCWRNIVGVNDARVADLIARDEIDILVDLSQHLSGNRLLALARKPAPIQASFAGYPAATGLRAIDYRITDPHLDPPAADDSNLFEKPLRLASSFWCYDESAMNSGLDEIPAVGPLPAICAGHVTFGCLNNFCKVNDRVLQLWSQVLHAIPDSHLLLLAPAGSARSETANRLAELGIAADCVEFVGHQPRMNYLKLYDRIDVGLDTFPYNGHTTSLDSLWMGVPVITLAGTTAVSRAGISQLTNLGLTDLIAHSPEDFVRIATDLVSDIDRLSTLRAGLRQRMRQSPIMDAGQFAKDVELAYRRMFKHSLV